MTKGEDHSLEWIKLQTRTAWSIMIPQHGIEMTENQRWYSYTTHGLI